MKNSSITKLIPIIIILLVSACGPVRQEIEEIIPLQGEEIDPGINQVENQNNLLQTSFYEEDLTDLNGLQSRLVELYYDVNPSVVFIINPTGSAGSGFVYRQDGYIITNNHVVRGTNNPEIVFTNGDRARAELVGSDVDSDLAILKVDQLPDGSNPLPLASPESILPGQFAVAIGNPFGEQGSMSLGIISGLGRSLPSQRTLSSGSTYSLPQVLQTDAPINPGNSGGPLLNLDGEVVGIATAIASETGSNSGVGFAIPVQAILTIAPDLIENGSYKYPYLGVGFDSEVSLDEQSLYGLSQTQGAYVLNVTDGSPADEAGLIPANPNTGSGGDLITAIDNLPVKNFGELNSYLVFSTSAGQAIELTVLRDGRTITISLTLGERP